MSEKAYECEHCHMSVATMVCGTCQSPLEHAQIEVDGNTVAVAKCPKGCGMIKSPQCCGHDMTSR